MSARVNRLRWAVAWGILLVGCGSEAPRLASRTGGNGELALANQADRRAGPRLVGEETEKPPGGILGGSSGIVGKNSSKFRGTVLAPFDFVTPPSRSFRAASLVQAPVGGAAVYLFDPYGATYTRHGRPLVALTDRLGRYEFRDVPIAVGQSVIITAALPGGKQLACYMQSGPNEVESDLDPASTFACYYLRREAALRVKTMDQFDFGKLQLLIGETRTLLDRTVPLADPELFCPDRLDALIEAYRRTLVADAPSLLAAWNSLLGPLAGASASAGKAAVDR